MNNFINKINEAIDNIEINNIADSEKNIWDAIKYLKGYDNIENTDITEKYITSESFTNSPWLSLNYFDPVIDINEDIIVPFYITNYNQDEWINDDYTTMFQIEIVFNGNVIRKIVHAGENEINIGKCPNLGEQYFTYQCTDLTTKIKSPMYVKHLLCIDKSIEKNIYEMTENDLVTYNINNTNNRELTAMENNIDGLNSFITNKKSEGYDGVKLLPGQYNVAPGNSRNRPVAIPSNFTLDMNGSKIKHVFTTKGSGSLIVKIDKDAIDSHIINGYIEGDYDEHDVTVVGDEAAAGSGIEGEGFNCISMGGAFCSLENVDIGWVTGYCACSGNNSEYVTNAQVTSSFKKCYIDSTGNEVSSDVFYTSEFYDITYAKNNCNFITACNYGGYGGYVGDSDMGYIHFYDGNRSYLKSTKFRQYSLIPIIQNAYYVKVTLYSTSTPSSTTFRVQGKKYIDMSNYKLLNINFHDTRTCALTTGIYDFQLVKNCTFDRCGQWLEQGRVTPVAIDIEDGYQWGQNYFFENNFYNTKQTIGSGTIIITCGYNVNMSNTNMSSQPRRVKGLSIKNSTIEGLNIITLSDKIKSGFQRIHDNVFTDELGIVVQDRSMFGKVKRCTFLKRLNHGTGYSPTNNKNITFDNCIFKSFETISGTVTNSIISDSSISNPRISADIYNSKITNVKNIINGPRIYNSSIDNCTFGQEGYIFNSTITNSQISYGYWDSGHTFEINNSTINNDKSLFRVPNYSLNYPLTINGNNIILTGTSSLIDLWDDRTNAHAPADYSTKFITISNNTIIKNDSSLVKGIGTNNIIKIKYINNDIKDAEGNVFTPTQEVHDNVEITVE